MPPKSKATDLWLGFAEALRNANEQRPVGAGWLTFPELAEKFKQVGKHRLRDKIAAHPMEKFTGYVNRNGKLTRQCWYRPAEKPIRPKEKP